MEEYQNRIKKDEILQSMSDNLNLQTKTVWHFVVWTTQLDLSLVVLQHVYTFHGTAFISYLSVDHGKDHKTIVQVKMEPQALLGFVPHPPTRTTLCGYPKEPSPMVPAPPGQWPHSALIEALSVLHFGQGSCMSSLQAHCPVSAMLFLTDNKLDRTNYGRMKMKHNNQKISHRKQH